MNLSPAPAVDAESLTPDLCGFPDVIVERDNVSTVNNAYYNSFGPLYQPPKPLWPGLDGGADATVWAADEVTFGTYDDADAKDEANSASWVRYYEASLQSPGLEAKITETNPTPGTGWTGHVPVPPNNYVFYSRFHDGIIYKQRIMDDKLGYLSEWATPYKPSEEELARHKEEAYRRDVPYGLSPEDDCARSAGVDDDKVTLLVRSELHHDSEYGTDVDADGKHSGGPGHVTLSLKMRIAEVHQVLRRELGLLPAHQCLAFAAHNLEDNQRTLEQYGVRYWHAKFPDWPLTVRRFKTGH